MTRKEKELQQRWNKIWKMEIDTKQSRLEWKVVDRLILDTMKLLRGFDDEHHPERVIGKRKITVLDQREDNNKKRDLVEFVKYFINSSTLKMIISALVNQPISLPKEEYIFNGICQLLSNLLSLAAELEIPSELFTLMLQTYKEVFPQIRTFLTSQDCNEGYFLSDHTWFLYLNTFQRIINLDYFSFLNNEIMCRMYLEFLEDYCQHLNLYELTNCRLFVSNPYNPKYSETGVVIRIQEYFVSGSLSSAEYCRFELLFRVIQFLNTLLRQLLYLSSPDILQSRKEVYILYFPLVFHLLEKMVLIYFSSHEDQRFLLPSKSFGKLWHYFSQNDQLLIEFVHQFLQLEVRLATLTSLFHSQDLGGDLNSKFLILQKLRQSLDENYFQSTLFLPLLISHIFSYDITTLIDLLSNNETTFLSYLLLFFKTQSRPEMEQSIQYWNQTIMSSTFPLIIKENTGSDYSGDYLCWEEDCKDVTIGKQSGQHRREHLWVERNQERVEPEISFLLENIDFELLCNCFHDLCDHFERLFALEILPFNPRLLCQRIRIFVK